MNDVLIAQKITAGEIVPAGEILRAVIDRLDAWADGERIVWTQTGDTKAQNRMTNYGRLSWLLGRILEEIS